MGSVVYMVAHAADLHPSRGLILLAVNSALVLFTRTLTTEQTTLKFYLRPVERDKRVETCKAPVIVVREESLNVRDTCDVT